MWWLFQSILPLRMNFEDLLNASFSLRRDAVDAITLWCGTRQGKSLFQDKSKGCSKAIVFRCRDRSCPFYMKLTKRTDGNWICIKWWVTDIFNGSYHLFQKNHPLLEYSLFFLEKPPLFEMFTRVWNIHFQNHPFLEFPLFKIQCVKKYCIGRVVVMLRIQIKTH